MKILSTLKDLIEKPIYYVEFNLLIIFMTLCILGCIFIILAFYDIAPLIFIDLTTVLLDDYLIICSILAGIFILNAIFFRKHISYDKKVPLWYKIIFFILLIVDIVWFIFIIIPEIQYIGVY